ncbi:sterol-binding-like protein [Gigaspora margarita]|uniref:Sterol-binding-like protein n=1 Tax=Gigaspora margarita TaxID=4874 RepID=A0A8H4AA70_GIGMA|nr:sterol-binding-like protein [Gigaspora margarita]
MAIEGFKSSAIFDEIQTNVSNEKTREDAIKKVKATFELKIKNPEGKEQIWTLDLKKEGTIKTGKGSAKPDIIMDMDDDTFVQLASGKLNGQKAFMSGKLKIKGNMMLATKLDGVLKSLTGPKAKL